MTAPSAWIRNEEHQGISSPPRTGSITNLMPGATETEFSDRAGMMAGKAHVVSGFMNKHRVPVANVTPTCMLAELRRRMAEPGSDEP